MRAFESDTVVRLTANLGFEHEALGRRSGLLEHGRCVGVGHVVQAPQACGQGIQTFRSEHAATRIDVMSSVPQSPDHKSAPAKQAHGQRYHGDPETTSSKTDVIESRCQHLHANHREVPPAKQTRQSSASEGESRKRSRTPGRARSCCTFLAPASW